MKQSASGRKRPTAPVNRAGYAPPEAGAVFIPPTGMINIGQINQSNGVRVVRKHWFYFVDSERHSFNMWRGALARNLVKWPKGA